MRKKIIKIRVLSVLLFLSLLGFSGADGATITEVPGTSDPWLAGMPPGSTASFGDIVPPQSPEEVLGFPFSPGDFLTFSVTGLTDHCAGGVCGLAGPEGDLIEGAITYTPGAQNGIAGLTALYDSLIGVFLGPSQPDLTPAPEALDFATPMARDFTTLSPFLKQPFYIGDGLRNDGFTVQTFVVPTGATRLFLGTMDGWGWYSNVGSLTVTVDTQPVPEPTTMLLLASGLMALVGFRKNFTK